MNYLERVESKFSHYLLFELFGAEVDGLVGYSIIIKSKS